MLRNDNDISICYSDLKQIFYGKEIVGYINAKKYDNVVNICKTCKQEIEMVIFLQDEKYDSLIIKQIIYEVNKKLSSNVTCVYGFKQSKYKKIIGLITC